MPGAQTFLIFIVAFIAVPAGFSAAGVVNVAIDGARSLVVSGSQHGPPRTRPASAAPGWAAVGAIALAAMIPIVLHAIFFWALRRTRTLGTDETSLGLNGRMWRGVLCGGYAVGFVGGAWAMWF